MYNNVSPAIVICEKCMKSYHIVSGLYLGDIIHGVSVGGNPCCIRGPVVRWAHPSEARGNLYDLVRVGRWDQGDTVPLFEEFQKTVYISSHVLCDLHVPPVTASTQCLKETGYKHSGRIDTFSHMHKATYKGLELAFTNRLGRSLFGQHNQGSLNLVPWDGQRHFSCVNLYSKPPYYLLGLFFCFLFIMANTYTILTWRETWAVLSVEGNGVPSRGVTGALRRCTAKPFPKKDDTAKGSDTFVLFLNPCTIPMGYQYSQLHPPHTICSCH